MKAAAQLVEELGGEVVKLLFLIELAGLEGRNPRSFVLSMLTLENSGTAIQIQSTVSISSPSISLDWNGIPAAHLYSWYSDRMSVPVVELSCYLLAEIYKACYFFSNL